MRLTPDRVHTATKTVPTGAVFAGIGGFMSLAAMLKYSDWTEANRALRVLTREKKKAVAEPTIKKKQLPIIEVPEPYVSEREPLWFPSNAPIQDVMIAGLDFDPIQHHGAMFLHVEGTLTARIDDRDAYLAAVRRLYGYRGSMVKRVRLAGLRPQLDTRMAEAYRASVDVPDLSALKPESVRALAELREAGATDDRIAAFIDEALTFDAPQAYGTEAVHVWGVRGLLQGSKVTAIYSGSLAALRWLWPDAETRRILKKAGCLNLDDLGIPLQIDDRTGYKCFDYYAKGCDQDEFSPAGARIRGACWEAGGRS